MNSEQNGVRANTELFEATGMGFIARIAISRTDIPTDYRRKFLSLLKHAIQVYGGLLMLEDFFGRARPKEYCLSLFLPGVKFSRDSVTLSESYVLLRVSSPDIQTLWTIYNALLSVKKMPYTCSGIDMTVEKIYADHGKPATEGRAVIKMTKPLALREHDREKNSDTFITARDDCFEEKLKKSIADQLDAFGMDSSAAESFKITDTLQCKTTVVTHYGTYMMSSAF